MNIQEGSVIDDKYRLGATLGQGGMGAVYEATDVRTGSISAVKVILTQSGRDPKYFGRLQREGSILSSLTHQNVVRVHDLGVDARTGTPYIVMERLSGEDCGRRVAAHGAMDPRQARVVLDQVCEALRAIHAKGIVHRDLKPENVFIVRNQQGNESIKLLDFGIAKLVSDSASNSVVVGTPHCIAPEQLAVNAAISPATDIWALGLLAFFVLTGKHYWLEANPSQPSQVDYGKMFSEIMNEASRELPSRRAVRLKCVPGNTPSTKFDEWFMRCVVNDPLLRIKDVTAAQRELSTVWRIDVAKVRPAATGPFSLPENDVIAHAADELRKRVKEAFAVMRDAEMSPLLEEKLTPPPPARMKDRTSEDRVSAVPRTVMASPVDFMQADPIGGAQIHTVVVTDIPSFGAQPAVTSLQSDAAGASTQIIDVSGDTAPPVGAVAEKDNDTIRLAAPKEPAPLAERGADKGPSRNRSATQARRAPPPPEQSKTVVIVLVAAVIAGLSALVALAVWQDAIRAALGLE